MYELNPSLVDGQLVIPVDLASAIVELDRMLSAPLKFEIKNSGASAQHRGVGMWIRNNWELCDTKRALGKDSLRSRFLARGIMDPDEMSSALLDCYCFYLQGQDVIEPPLLNGDERLCVTGKIGQLNPRPLILGLGTAGEAFAIRLQQGTFFRDQLVAVDVFGFDRHSTDGNRLARGISLASKILLVVCGGGTTSSVMAEFVASWAKFKNVQLDVIMSTPMSWEGRKRAAKAAWLLEFLHGAGANVTTLVGDHYDDPEAESFRVIFSRVDCAMLKEVQAWAN